jgi:site-specific DNA-methyltransferase (adenine-specific)
MIEIINNDNMEVLKTMEESSLDSIVTDPPYGISFMNKKWDYDVPSVKFWEEALRVLKPGGHILVFCGTKTQHRMAVNIEDAGFEIRDVITWLYGQGFPKSYNIANGIEGFIKNGSSNTKDYKKLEGTPKKKSLGFSTTSFEQGVKPADYTKDGKDYLTDIQYSTDEALQWDGWGTALKPACEFITLARKPISEKTIVKNVLKWGVGGINIDATRIELNGEIVPINKLEDWSGFGQLQKPEYIPTENVKGRFPANLVLDEIAGEMLGEQKRFFYCSKASKKEKGEFSNHPTVKPLELMKYLVKLITPFKGKCLDPFLGSGTTALACKELGFDFIGIEKEKEYYEIALRRL